MKIHQTTQYTNTNNLNGGSNESPFSINIDIINVL